MRGRTLKLGFAAAAFVGSAVVACTGSDPEVFPPQNPADAGSSGASGTSGTSGSSGTSGASSDEAGNGEAGSDGGPDSGAGLDPSFGGGVVFLNGGELPHPSARTTVLDGLGVLVGGSLREGGIETPFVLRLAADGLIDRGFGTSGVAEATPGETAAGVSGPAVGIFPRGATQANIVVAGNSGNNAWAFSLDTAGKPQNDTVTALGTIARLTPEGDIGFGVASGGSFVTFSAGVAPGGGAFLHANSIGGFPHGDSPGAITHQSPTTEAVIWNNASSSGVFLERITAGSGESTSIDTVAYGDRNTPTAASPDATDARALAIGTGGAGVICTWTTVAGVGSPSKAWPVTPQGQASAHFDLPISPRQCLLDAQNRLIVVGSTVGGSVESFAMYRTVAGDFGAADPSFGTNGLIVVTAPDNGSSRAVDAIPAAGGSIYVVGTRASMPDLVDPDAIIVARITP